MVTNSVLLLLQSGRFKIVSSWIWIESSKLFHQKKIVGVIELGTKSFTFHPGLLKHLLLKPGCHDVRNVNQPMGNPAGGRTRILFANTSPSFSWTASFSSTWSRNSIPAELYPNCRLTRKINEYCVYSAVKFGSAFFFLLKYIAGIPRNTDKRPLYMLKVNSVLPQGQLSRYLCLESLVWSCLRSSYHSTYRQMRNEVGRAERSLAWLHVNLKVSKNPFILELRKLCGQM